MGDEGGRRRRRRKRRGGRDGDRRRGYHGLGGGDGAVDGARGGV